MNTYSTFIDANKFQKDFTHLYFGADEDVSLMKNLLEILNESNLSAKDFLKNIDSIEDEKVQKCCRMAAIAQMYNANLDNGSGYPYLESPLGALDSLLIQFQNSTAVVSKYGEIIINEGEISTKAGRYYGGGAFVTDVNTKLYGSISSNGYQILPCIFDSIENHNNFFLDTVKFKLVIYGDQSSISKEALDQLIKWFDYDSNNKRFIVCRSHGVLYCLITNDWYCNPQNGEPYSIEVKGKEVPRKLERAKCDAAVQKVKTAVSQFSVSKDELIQLLATK